MVYLEDCSEELLRWQQDVSVYGSNYPFTIQNQRGASKIPLVWGILRSKAPSRGLWMPELVLYGITLLAKQFLGAILDIEVDQSAPD